MHWKRRRSAPPVTVQFHPIQRSVPPMSTVESTKDDVGFAPAQGQITDQAIADAKAMIGLQLRPEGPYLQDVSIDTIRNFCNGIGDLNPMYRDAEHARQSRYGSVV